MKAARMGTNGEGGLFGLMMMMPRPYERWMSGCHLDASGTFSGARRI